LLHPFAADKKGTDTIEAIKDRSTVFLRAPADIKPQRKRKVRLLQHQCKQPNLFRGALQTKKDKEEEKGKGEDDKYKGFTVWRCAAPASLVAQLTVVAPPRVSVVAAAWLTLHAWCMTCWLHLCLRVAGPGRIPLN
jgi:hypothetical protein